MPCLKGLAKSKNEALNGLVRYALTASLFEVDSALDVAVYGCAERENVASSKDYSTDLLQAGGHSVGVSANTRGQKIVPAPNTTQSAKIRCLITQSNLFMSLQAEV